MSDNHNNNKHDPEQGLERAAEEEYNPIVPRPSADQITSQSEKNLEEAFGNLFKNSVSGTGEEELLRIASRYSLQMTAKQIKCLLFLEHKAKMFEELYFSAKKQNDNKWIKYKFTAEYLRAFVAKWLQLKEHNNSDVFVMRALDSVALRKYINENSMKINIEK